MEMGRTSCTNFWANQFRVLMTAAAYVLMQELRLGLAGTGFARGQVPLLRHPLLKPGGPVVGSGPRLVLHLPRSFPYRNSFHRLALSLGAQTGFSFPLFTFEATPYLHSYSSCLLARRNRLRMLRKSLESTLRPNRTPTSSYRQLRSYKN